MLEVWSCFLTSLATLSFDLFFSDFTYGLHVVSYGLCGLMPLLSTLAHTFHCRSAAWYIGWWDADHVGILSLWVARALCEGYVLLYCFRGTWLLWAGASVLVFAWATVEVVRTKSTALFLPLYAYIHLPIVFAATFDDDFWPAVGRTAISGRGGAGAADILESSGDALAGDVGEALRSGVGLTLVGSLCGVLGYGVMVAKVPERFSPGTFDTWGHSHQWWHMLTILGPVLCLEAGRGLLAARLSHACTA